MLPLDWLTCMIHHEQCRISIPLATAPFPRPRAISQSRLEVGIPLISMLQFVPGVPPYSMIIFARAFKPIIVVGPSPWYSTKQRLLSRRSRPRLST